MRETVHFCGIEEIAARIDKRKTLILSDRRIHSLFGGQFPDCPLVFVPEGEAAKSLDVLAELFRQFIAFQLDRSWKILVIGGGSISDLGGYAAHSWLRGIGFMFAPTTLLAMTDASLGGKNGIDFQGFKNVVGSFQNPEAIFCDIDTLRRLDGRQFASGMAEVIKHGIIDGEEYFAFLEKTLASQAGNGNLDYMACPGETLRHMVAQSQRVKLNIVQRDPREAGERRILNLGHSFGHAIEVVSGMPHGYCVALGIVLACSFSMRRGYMTASTAQRIVRLLSGYGLPVDTASLQKDKDRMAETLFMDKKREGAWMNLVIPKDIGSVIVEKVAIPELKAFLDEAVV
ncbi:MAG: 3-dehydroquinate synthase [Spirochaetae bacterium HGW-Spirochaetae-9]|nr:MAG: 3-dehydroquinate synthase [Spirochaetae bacterium HGW-Spirochaetae-9]